MWEDVSWVELNRLMYGLAFSCHCTSECNLAGSPFIKCAAGFPHQWHPENTTKIFGSISYTTTYHLLKERRIIHTWSACLWYGHSCWVYSVCEWWDWILQWERKIRGPCGQVLLMPRISHLKWYGDWIHNTDCFPLMLDHTWDLLKCVTCKMLEVYHEVQHSQKWPTF
jgi:hypothetical protein